MLHDLAHVLGLIARGDQQRVIGLYDYKIAYTNRRDELSWRMDVIPLGVQRECTFAVNEILIGRFAL